MLSALRLIAYLLRNRLDDDLAEEIRNHLELRTKALIDNGGAPAEAAREARRQFGNVTAMQERTRVVLGVAVALLGGAALRSLLIGIGPADPVSFVSAILLLLLVGAAASYVPARSALSVDPSTALRSE